MVGYLWYIAQLGLVQIGLTNTMYLSSKNKRYMETIVLLAEQNVDAIICRTLFIGRPLMVFTKPIVLSLPPKSHTRLNLLDETVYDRVVRTLSAVTAIDVSTQIILFSLFGMDFSGLIPTESSQ